MLVSHSRALAEGVAVLAREMGGEVPIALAAGLDDPPGAIGTDALKVLAAIEQVYSDDGVVILMDLGSAVLSAETALEFLDEDRRARVRLCDAPFVEGAIAAATQARLGASLAQVVAEAEAAGRNKVIQPKDVAVSSAPALGSGAVQSAQFTLPNRLGIHARPAARIVQMLSGLQAEVTLRNLTLGTGAANARSLNALLLLGARQGHVVEVQAVGPDAARALEQLRAFFAENLGDPPEEAMPTAASSAAAHVPQGALLGVAAAPGVAIGEARWVRHSVVSQELTLSSGDAQQELQRLQHAFARARTRIQTLIADTTRKHSAHAAAIFQAQLLLLEEPAFFAAAEALVQDGASAEQAVLRSAAQLAQTYAQSEDAVLRARAADVEDVARHVLVELGASGATEAQDVDSSVPVVLCAERFAPSEVARLPTNVVALCAVQDSVVSHAAILARAAGLPAVFGIGEALREVHDRQTLLVDGEGGFVLSDPPEAVRLAYRERIAEREQQRRQAEQAAHLPAITRGGRRVEVVANIGGVADAQRALEQGAEGVGLFRTEFLFLERPDPPSEEEQYRAYREVATLLEGRRLVVRTLDVGGDKPLPWLTLPKENNPFLGLRGLRLCLARPEVFRTQLRALARVAAEFPLHVMFPMVSTLDEWRAARAMWEEAARPLNAHAALGIMVETPAAALQAEAFAREVDFFSIGTNDLTQYVFAAERGNPALAHLNDAFHPATLELIERVCRAAHAQGKWVGVCGELGADERAIPALVAIGVDELSVAPAAVSRVKQCVRALP
ncbi:MAG: phosphoenolpyruvate--protein phosphotransferase [Thermoflexales bacterium]|nr:phosphoenolpyruvate--protein phosphotransferase [Thermoflexales bacterium]